MKNIFTAILFLSVAFGFGQNKTVEKKVTNEKPVVAPVKVDSNKEKNNIKGDTEVTAPKEDLDYSPIFTSVEINAQPKEGMNSFRKYFSTSFRTPEVDDNVDATIQVRFVVFEDGSLHDFQILKETPIGLGLGKEAIRVLKTSENWIPGQMHGKIVKQYYTFPIKIQIQGLDTDTPSSEEVKAKSDSELTMRNDGEAYFKKRDYSEIFTSAQVQVQAYPPEGMNAFRKYIVSSCRLPVVTEPNMGKVFAKFVVWDDGSIRNIQIIEESPIGLGLGDEVTRVLNSSVKWVPGMFNDFKVKQEFTLLIPIFMTPKEN